MRTLLVAAALIIVGCGGTAGGASSPSPPLPSEIPLAGSFATLPYTLDFPDGWVFGTDKNLSVVMESAKSNHPELAAEIDKIVRESGSTSDMFMAFEVGSGDPISPPYITGVTLDLGNTPVAGVLDEYERQNVAGVAKMPGIEGEVSSDRIQLPVGETVRVRWRNVLPADSGETGDTSSTGYAFIVDTTIYTFVFTAATDTAASRESEWERILGTFKVKPSP